MVRKGAEKKQKGAASRLKELTTLYFTSEMLERDQQRHKGAKSQQRADMTLEADCHKAGMLKQIAWHKARVAKCYGSRGYIRVKKWLNVEKMGNFNGGKSLFVL